MEGLTNRKECPLLLKDEHHKWSEHERAGKRSSAQLPGNFSLPRSRVDPAHDSDDVDGGEYIEQLKEEVPFRRFGEDICVS